MDTEQLLRPCAAAPTLALIHRLQSDRQYRDAHRLFFIEGIRNFVSAIDAGYTVDTLVYSERLLIVPIARKLVRQLKRSGVRFARVSPEMFRSISHSEQASGVAAIMRQTYTPLHQINPHQQRCWVALSAVRSLGNLGTLVRTAAASGASGFLLLGNVIDPFDPAVVRAAMGTLFQQTMVRTKLPELQAWAGTQRVQVIGASPDGTLEYDQADYQHPVVLLLGEERTGLSAAQRAICDQLVRIPMVNAIDSLNLAVAGSLLLYEVLRTVRRMQ
jgi:TrmH family RNA methyltransferase